MNIKLQKVTAILCFGTMLCGAVLMGHRSSVQPQRAIYYWKTSFEKNYDPDAKDSFLTQHQIKKMYIKMLDVDYSEAAGIYPASKTKLYFNNSQNLDSIEYVPVIYVTNRVLKHITDDKLDEYAKKFLQHALRIETFVSQKTKQIQIDCDWTESTKDVYFKLLNRMRYWAPQYEYSVTLRLYPFKYREELGIPPVNRVMLMMYNIENAKNFATENSIFNGHEAFKYLKRKDYPLPMDFALPVFSWTLIFRNQQFLRVVNNNLLDELKNEQQGPQLGGKENLSYLGPNTYLVKTTPNQLNDFELKAGDILKIESCGESQLKDASFLVQQFKLTPQTTISLFDLDMNELNKISNESIEQVYSPNF